MVDMNIVTVYDINNKFIAYSAPVPDVIDVISEWGSLYVLGGDRKVSGPILFFVNVLGLSISDYNSTLYGHVDNEC